MAYPVMRQADIGHNTTSLMIFSQFVKSQVSYSIPK